MGPMIKKHFAAKYIDIGNNAKIFIELVRKYKTAKNISLSSTLDDIYYSASKELSETSLFDLQNTANAKKIIFRKNLDMPSRLVSKCNSFTINIETLN